MRIFGLFFVVVSLLISTASSEPPVTTQPAGTTGVPEDRMVLLDEKSLAIILENMPEDLWKAARSPETLTFLNWSRRTFRDRPIRISGKFNSTTSSLMAEADSIKTSKGLAEIVIVVEGYADKADTPYKWLPGDKLNAFGFISGISCGGTKKPTNAVPNPPMHLTIYIHDALVGRVPGPQSYKKNQQDKRDNENKK